MNTFHSGRRRLPRGALLLSALLSASGCGLLDDGPLAFPWVEVGNSLVYDYRAVTLPLLRSETGEELWYVERRLEIRIEAPGGVDFTFREYIPNGGPLEREPMLELIGFHYVVPGPERATDGIRVRRPEKCNAGALLQDTFTSLRVPARPKVGQKYYYYACKGRPETEYEITAVDVPVTVPAGTFTTFVMLSRQHAQRHYWSEAEGLIKMEFLNEDGTLRGAYELASRNFGTAQ